MSIVERHTSPDGLLELIVDLGEDGDWLIGFDGYEWHTHGDLLAHAYGGTPESAVHIFVDDIISSRSVIVISRVDGIIQDIRITDVSDSDMKYAHPNESIELRLWDGPYSARNDRPRV